MKILVKLSTMKFSRTKYIILNQGEVHEYSIK